MSGEDSGESKTEEATDHKLDKQRKKGQFAKSIVFPDLLKYCIGTLTIYLFSSVLLRVMGNYFDQVSKILPNKSHSDYVGTIATLNFEIAALILMFMLLMIAVALLAHGLFAGGFPGSFELIKPKFSKLNPISQIKQIFGRRGQSETWIGFCYAVIWVTMSGATLWAYYEYQISGIVCGLDCELAIAQEMLQILFGGSVLLCLFVIIIDLPLQKALFMNDQKMTKSELKRDHKESYGNPEVKSEMKRIAREGSEGQSSQMPNMPQENAPMQKQTQQDKSNISAASFLAIGSNYGVAIRFNENDENPVPIVISTGHSEELTKLASQAKEAGLPIFYGQKFADTIGPETSPGAEVEETYYYDIAPLLAKSRY